MLRRLSVMLQIQPHRDAGVADLRLTDARTRHPLSITRRCSLVLTMEREPQATFVRGHVRLLGDDIEYPIQTSVGLFEALAGLVADAKQIAEPAQAFELPAQRPDTEGRETECPR